MYIIKITMPNKNVYLKERIDDSYVYTNSLKESMKWTDKEDAETLLKKIKYSVLEKLEIIEENDLYVERYFYNYKSNKIQLVKILKEVCENNLNYFETLEEAVKNTCRY